MSIVDLIRWVMLVAIIAMAASEQSGPSAQTSPSGDSAVALRADGLTAKEFRERFKRLSDQDIVEVKGRRLTKAQLAIEIGKKSQEARARIKGNSAQSQVHFKAIRNQYEAEQKATLDADNVRSRADFARLKQQWGSGGPVHVGMDVEREQLRREAAELIRRMGKASPAEQAEIEKRAQKLLQKARGRK